MICICKSHRLEPLAGRSTKRVAFATDGCNSSCVEPRNASTKVSFANLPDNDDVTGSENEDETGSTFQRHNRRPSIAVQLLSPSKWVHQKDYQRKMSLHGKPIYFTVPSKRQNRIRKFKLYIFNFLERPGSTVPSLVYHIATFLFIFCCLVVSVYETIESFHSRVKGALLYMEVFVLFQFFCEIVLRIWSSGCRIKYHGFKGKIKFMKKPFSIIDTLVTIASSVLLIIGRDEDNCFASHMIWAVRFLQILRLVRIDRNAGTWKLLRSVVNSHKKELLTAWYIGLLTLLFLSFFVYQAEKQHNKEQFNTFADAIWWALITLTTIGYGDKTPHTWIGRIIASIFAILGISFFALPAGILGSGFALKVQEVNREKHFARRRAPAAVLIQSVWRCYAADEDSTSNATWQPCLRAQIVHHQAKRQSQRSKLQRRRSVPISGAGTSPKITRRNACSPDEIFYYQNELEASKEETKSFTDKFADRLSKMGLDRRKSEEDMLCDSDDTTCSSASANNNVFTELSPLQKRTVRCIRRMKFLVAKKKFKGALRPYDVKDVIEQYSAGHSDMLLRLKYLQGRIDSIAGSDESTMQQVHGGSIRSRKPNYNRWSLTSSDSLSKKLTMNERLHNVEKKISNMDKKLDLLIKAVLTKSEDSPPENCKKLSSGVKKKCHFSLAEPKTDRYESKKKVKIKDHGDETDRSCEDLHQDEVAQEDQKNCSPLSNHVSVMPGDNSLPKEESCLA